ncbi:MAG TPA: hypothetical protein VJY36_03525 [Candidatus Bathyarchaeia archaeon]|nr:hypothetical protein [Candidatus Bathyarchaeia archaeon]
MKTIGGMVMLENWEARLPILAMTPDWYRAKFSGSRQELSGKLRVIILNKANIIRRVKNIQRHF